MINNINSKIQYPYFSLPNTFYELITPSFDAHYKIDLINKDVLSKIDLALLQCSAEELLEIFLASKEPRQGYAQAYAGHQYGMLNMLGDGRVLNLGTLNNNGKYFDLQIKGYGLTKYSRGGDGKASLDSMLYEYLYSEALRGLDIATSQSLMVFSDYSSVYRNKELLRGYLLRSSSSFLRIATFEYAFHYHKPDLVQELSDYTISLYFKELINKPNKYYEMLDAIIKKQAALVAKWQCVGFVHGVMNTDNTCITGETIDFGPCAFMDIYKPHQSFSQIDYYHRYAYSKQPSILKWNIARLLECFSTLLSNEDLNKLLDLYDSYYNTFYDDLMSAKFNLDLKLKSNLDLIATFFKLLEEYQLDFNNSFTFLTYYQNNDNVFREYLNNPEFMKWYALYEQALKESTLVDQRKVVNPIYVLKNHQVIEVIDAYLNNNKQPLLDVLAHLKDPYHVKHLKQLEAIFNQKELYNPLYKTHCRT
ncbi:MAG: protein adenylyltransferase SelO family protein [Bacilli bacterium]